MIRKRICFSKKGNLKFIGHLDFLRVFGEMVSRSRLPAGFSSGFNPHILLSFALPLPLGFESENDYADLVFDEDVSHGEVVERLNNTAPNGLEIKSVYDAQDKCASVVSLADYSLQAPGLPESFDKNVLLQNSIMVQKKTKSGIKNTDIRSDIISVEVLEDKVFMRLAAGSARFLHPVLAIQAIFGFKPSPVGFVRLEMYKINHCGSAVKL